MKDNITIQENVDFGSSDSSIRFSVEGKLVDIGTGYSGLIELVMLQEYSVMEFNASLALNPDTRSIDEAIGAIDDILDALQVTRDILVDASNS